MFVASFIKLFRLFIFLLLMFSVNRLMFLIYFNHELHPQQLQLLVSTLWHALPLDISTACYLLFIPVLLITSVFFSSTNLIAKILMWYMIFVAIVYFLLGIGEIGVYQEMRIKIYYNAFARIFHPSEILDYISFRSIAEIIITLILAIGFTVLSFDKIVGKIRFQKPKGKFTKVSAAFLFFLISVPILIIGCRGGLQPVAINEGEVCFSNNQCANDAAINAFWNLGHSYIETKKSYQANTYKAMSDDEANKIVLSLYHVQIDTTISLFKVKHPNVCILILEGWHTDLIESLGGYKNLTPNFERLVKQGYLFTSIKSSGHISDQGIAAIFGAYPALTFGSIINQNEKQLSMPCIGKNFHEENYYSSFLYGGQLMYGGIKKFISLNQFNSIAEQKNFLDLPTGKMGIHDSLMFNVWRDSLLTFPQPFFSCYFTLSTHSPYDVVAEQTITWADDENKYFNSAVYADRQLGKFFHAIEHSSFFENTIFIIVADHGHHTPKNYNSDSPEHYHIPLLFYGGALKEEYRGTKNKKLGSQLDLASTMLHQLGIGSDKFIWSKNLMNPYTTQFAFYAFNDGFGYCESDKSVVWNRKFPTHNLNTGSTAEEKNVLQKKGAALLQEVMNDFLRR